MSTLAPIISDTGISTLSYQEVYDTLVTNFKLIYGSDIYISADSQDGQWLAIIAKAIFDCNNVAVTVYQSFSPTFSQGAMLSSMVKINGITRNSSGYSTATCIVVGTVGTTILAGIAQDTNGNLWNLPTRVIIGISGSETINVTCQMAGAIIALAGTINVIGNPQYGWQSITNPADAAIGAPVETDAALKLRQSLSVALPSQTVMDGILSSIANVSGVTRYTGYSNDTAITDSNGVPAHSMAIVVYGGSSTDIANVIALKKMPGSQTYGTTAITVYSSYGYPTIINYSQLAIIPIYFDITIVKLAGYLTTTDAAIKTALMIFIDNLDIGEDVYISQAQASASLIGLGVGQTFYITSFKMGTSPSPSGTSNIAISSLPHR